MIVCGAAKVECRPNCRHSDKRDDLPPRHLELRRPSGARIRHRILRGSQPGNRAHCQ